MAKKKDEKERAVDQTRNTRISVVARLNAGRQHPMRTPPPKAE